MLTKSLRITHVLWATNEYLAGAGKRDTDKCPLCGADKETNAHLKGHCPDMSVKSIRTQMISDIAGAVESELGESMPEPAWQAIARMWSTESLGKAHPESSRPSLEGIRCKTCRKRHKCRHRGKVGHLPVTQAPGEASESEDDETEQAVTLAPSVRECIADMRRPGARTAWAGWFPKSFARLLASFGIPASKAHELALEIREIITQGMDDIWRERNAAQHNPKEREEINAKITEAYNTRVALGIDTSPYHAAEEIHKRPYKIKLAWLTKATERNQAKVEDNKRRAEAVRAIAGGGCPKWNKDADIQTKNATRRNKGAATTTAQQKSPWDTSPAAAPRGSYAFAAVAKRAGAAKATRAPAAAAAAAAAAGVDGPKKTSAAGPSTAGIKLPPSDDPKRTKQKRQPRISDWLKDRGHENPPTEPTKDKRERDPEVTDQDDDPNQIDDVV